MPYSTQPANQKNQFTAFAKAATVFVTAVGGYVFARASGVFSGWGSEANTAADGLAIRNEENALSIQTDSSLSAETKLPSFDAKAQSLSPTGLTEFNEIQLTQQSSETSSAETLTLQSHSRSKRVDPPIGNEFQVNTYTTGYQSVPELVSLANGNVMVLWLSDQQDGHEDGIFGQVLSAGGGKVGLEFQVNTYTTESQRSPALASLANGNVMAIRDGNGQTDFGVYGQVLTVGGAKVGSEFLLNTYTLDTQNTPVLTGLSNGNVMAVWMSNGQDGSNFGIYGQVLTVGGGKVGSEFRVNTYTTGYQSGPALVSLTNGNVMAVWMSDGQDGSLNGVYGQVLTVGGGKVGSEFRVNTYTTGQQSYPAPVSLTNGNVMVVWGSNFGIYGQVLTVGGGKVGSEFRVNTYTTGNRSYPALASLTNGDVMVAWVSSGQDGSGNGIYGQELMVTGAKIGREFQINTYTANNQVFPVLTSLADGNVMVVWQSDGQDGDDFGVYGRVFTTDSFLENNQLTLQEGQTVILSGVNFSSSDFNNPPADLQFTVRNVQHGFFARTNAPTQSISQFTQADINNGVIQFIHDGGELPPSYETAVTDGVTPLTWHAASITFTPIKDAPILSTNELAIQEGQRLTLTELNLRATDEETAFGDLRFIVSNVQHGMFSWLNTVTPIAQFSQQNIMDGQMQFTHDGTEIAPSYDVSVGDGDITMPPAPATIDFDIVNDPPILLANQLNITEGATVVLSETNLEATDEETAFGNLNFIVSNVQHGMFSWLNSVTPIAQFSQQDITDGQVRFTHDGANVAPSYAVSVSDGEIATTPVPAIVNFDDVNDPPVLLTNQLNITEGATVVLSEASLDATDEETPDSDLEFIAEQVQFGEFRRIVSGGNVPVTQFTRRQIDDGLIQFAHDHSENAPSYRISVSDGIIVTAPMPATINFAVANDPPILLANQLNITEGATVVLSEMNLEATDEETPDYDFEFKAEQVRFGEFQRVDLDNENATVTQFTRQQINDGLIQFVHDHSDNAPSYQISVSDNKVDFSTPQAANITFNPVHDPSSTPAPVQVPVPGTQATDWIGLLPVILGAGGGGLLVFTIITGILAKRYRDQKKMANRDQIELKDLKQRLVFAEVLMGGDLEKIRQGLRADKVGEAGRSVIGGKWALMNKITREEAQLLEEQTGYRIEFKENETEAPVSIGSGHFGKVRLAKNIEIDGEYVGRFVGVKKIKGEGRIQASLQEAGIQSKLADVAHIMPLYDAKETQGNQGQRTLYQFMLFAGFGSGEKLKAAIAKISDVDRREQLVLQMAHQMLKGFAGMHAKGICHLDFKPSNMVIDNQGKGYIIDFGCAKELGIGKEWITDFKKDLGDFNYFSVERLEFYRRGKTGMGGRERYSGLSYDMWTLGLTLYELVANEHLLKKIALEEEVTDKGAEFVVNYLSTQKAFRNANTHTLWKLIEGLLLPEEKRLTAKQALKQFFGKMQDLPFADEENYQQAFSELKALALPAPGPRALTLTGVKAAKQYPDKKDEYELAPGIDGNHPHKKNEYEFTPDVDGNSQEKNGYELAPAVDGDLHKKNEYEITPNIDDNSLEQRRGSHSGSPTQTFFKPEAFESVNNNSERKSGIPGLSHQPVEEKE